MNDAPRYWFPAKRYGWGWGPPIAWQGWVVTIGWLAAQFALALLVAPHDMPAFVVSTLLLTLVLIGICFAKGEPPSWRWGDGP